MRRITLSAITSLGTLFVSQTALAAAFQFYELGTPVVGTAGVGQAVLATDASISYFNPAGMTQLPSSEYLVGAEVLQPYINFSQSSRTTISGDNGGNAATVTPIIGLYYVYSYSPKLKLGISLTSPYGGNLTYNDGWVGRYIVQTMDFYTFDLNPVAAYKFNDWVSVGAGIVVEYANLHQTVALPIIKLVDGQANLKLDNTSPGFNLGVMLTPTQTTQLGIAYRSKIIHNFRGTTTFLRIAATPGTSTTMVMPHNIIMSLAQGISDKFTLLGELGWSNWATMKDTVIHIQNYSATTPLNWRNTYRVGVGGQYHFTPAFLLQAGASYDSSPTVSSRRLPDLPMDRQIRMGAGIEYSVIKAIQLGFSYEYINFGNANINNISSDGALVGSYSRNYANVVQASINVAV